MADTSRPPAGAGDAPSSDVDPFADEVLEYPYEFYRELRAAGPAVWLSRYGVWAISRYEDVFQILRDHETFASAPLPAIEPERPDLPRGTLIGTDPPEHDRLRALISDKLAPRALRGLRAEIEARADEMVREVLERDSFDAAADLAQRFPVEVVADLVGFPREERADLLSFASAAFNTFGPMNERTVESLAGSQGVFEYIATAASRERIMPGSWGAALYEAVDAGSIEEHEAFSMMVGYLVAGMDTTVNAIGSAIWLLADRPAAWEAIQSDPSLVRAAFEETLRLESPVSFFCRSVKREAYVAGARVSAGERVMLFFGSANRDERKWGENAHEFDLSRGSSDHVAFGGGIHSCAGQGLARIEGPALLASLARRAGTLAMDGEPRRHLNNTIRGFDSVPVRVESRSQL